MSRVAAGTIWILFSTVALAQGGTGEWRFAVSGDSRNCGDIVMPAIAAGVRSNGAEFYWHLGDFRAIYTFDEDMGPQPNIIGYEVNAWPDFIAHQLAPFGDLPVYLAMGNHETIPPANRDQFLIQFADWLDTPVLRTQRLHDDPRDHKPRSYYHWVSHGVDFITLDNASTDQFDSGQMEWFQNLIQRDSASPEIQTIVAGMHEALPGSASSGHSMDDWPSGQVTGRAVYEALWHAREAAHKNVYVVASHSHLYMEDIYDTTSWKGKVLPGWIVGTAGAFRYKVPPEAGPAQKATAGVYGYLVGTVGADGAVAFEFHEVGLEDLLRANQGKQPEPLVRWCFSSNKE